MTTQGCRTIQMHARMHAMWQLAAAGLISRRTGSAAQSQLLATRWPAGRQSHQAGTSLRLTRTWCAFCSVIWSSPSSAGTARRWHACRTAQQPFSLRTRHERFKQSLQTQLLIPFQVDHGRQHATHARDGLWPPTARAHLATCHPRPMHMHVKHPSLHMPWRAVASLLPIYMQ
jgi:hypothetical protein